MKNLTLLLSLLTTTLLFISCNSKTEKEIINDLEKVIKLKIQYSLEYENNLFKDGQEVKEFGYYQFELGGFVNDTKNRKYTTWYKYRCYPLRMKTVPIFEGVIKLQTDYDYKILTEKHTYKCILGCD